MADPLHEPPGSPPEADEPTHSIGGDPPPASGFWVGRPLPSLPCRLGRYELLRRIGSGGMGAVYLAHDSQLDRRVALKIPLIGGPRPDLRRERFVREARAAATISHPNICPIFDVGEVDGTPYMTMAFVDGRPLTASIRPGRPFPEQEAAELVRAVALAMAEAHRAGVVHRDLKPSNIMINRQDQPVITDFGLASVGPGMDAVRGEDGTVVGTPAYMPPEQINGDANLVGVGSDVYSLGVILYELLTGRPPFEGKRGELITQVLYVPPPPPSRFQPALSPAIEAICLTALQKHPADRYRSMQSFADALDHFLATRPAVRRPDLAPVAAAGARAGEATGPVTDRVTDTEVINADAGKPRRRRARWLWPAAIVLAALVVLLWPAKRPGAVRIRLSNPAAAVEVRVDGRLVARGEPVDPMQLPPGGHTVEVTGANFEPTSVAFQVEPGGDREVPVTLRARSGPKQSQEMPASATISQTETDRAEKAATEAVRANPASAEPYLARAKVRLQHGQVDAARADAEQALRLAPNNPAARYMLAECMFKQLEYGPCIEETTRVIRDENAPDNLRDACLDTRSKAYIETGNDAAAIDDCTGALRIAPDVRKPVYLMRRAALYERQGDTKQAQADRAAALKLDHAAVEFSLPRSPAMHAR